MGWEVGQLSPPFLSQSSLALKSAGQKVRLRQYQSNQLNNSNHCGARISQREQLSRNFDGETSENSELSACQTKAKSRSMPTNRQPG